jgi:pyridoxamine 5'-phosphate oxidase
LVEPKWTLLDKNDGKVQMTDNRDQLLHEIWEMLHKGATDSQHPFYTPALATVSKHGAAVRTVVLREVDPANRLLVCHTHAASMKVAQLTANPATSWLFYSAPDKIQIRAEGQTTLHHNDEFARRIWEQSRVSSLRGYLTQLPPGAWLIGKPVSGLPAEFEDRLPTREEAEAGWQNFAVIATKIERLDWLYLGEGGRGQRRAEFTLQPEGGHSLMWIIP